MNKIFLFAVTVLLTLGASQEKAWSNSVPSVDVIQSRIASLLGNAAYNGKLQGTSVLCSIHSSVDFKYGINDKDHPVQVSELDMSDSDVAPPSFELDAEVQVLHYESDESHVDVETKDCRDSLGPDGICTRYSLVLKLSQGHVTQVYISYATQDWLMRGHRDEVCVLN